jgi:cellulose synthase/poly-beta-1,6-N-acetylglucosamine synthase-like glycosyltransferase
MKIQLLVCTLNEAANIQARLRNLRAMQVPEGFDFSIHVLDNGSKDQTCVLSKAVSTEPGSKIFIHELEPIGKCAALFWGFEHLKADYYLLTDANTVFERNILSVLCQSILEHPLCGVFVGNTRSVHSEKEGEEFLARGNASLPSRMRLEQQLRIFTGANGGCYAVASHAIDGIWTTPSIRNDDFAISVYAATRGTVCYLREVKAYEVENLNLIQAFQQKYRDALGHHQAVHWLLDHCGDKAVGRKAVFLRLCYWCFPLMLALLVLITLGPFVSAISALLLQLIPRMHRATIRTIALYLGFFFGYRNPPSVRWETTR